MKWSKLKKLVEDRFAPSVKGRVAINSAAYGNCSCGHAWLTIDKIIVANFCTRAFFNRGPTFVSLTKGFIPGMIPGDISNKYKHQFTEYGELSRQDAFKACFSSLHDLSIDEALISDNPLIQSLAVLDYRVGKRRLKTIKTSQLHRLAHKLLQLRINEEESSYWRMPVTSKKDRASELY